jgi:hypothetical protein
VKEPLEGFVKPVGKRLHRGLRDALATASLELARKMVAAKKRTRLVVVMIVDQSKHLVLKAATFRQSRQE